MHEKDFVVGSVLRKSDDEVFVKVGSGYWSMFEIQRYVDGEDMDEILEKHSDSIKVLANPSGLEVLDGLPSGSVVTAGEAGVALKYGEDWKIGGMDGWYGSSAVVEILGDFEVVREGVEA